MNHPLLTVVVPCFNEEKALPYIYQSICTVFETLKQKNFNGECIFVDDGSKDATKDILEALSAKDDRIHFVVFSRNFGKEAALLAGLQKSPANMQ
jgi:glycosyltransferase involved in cell wall biosynthesis